MIIRTFSPLNFNSAFIRTKNVDRVRQLTSNPTKRGVILTVLEKYNIPTYSYTPMEVKQVLTGYGRADKKEVEQMVKITLETNTLPKLDDTVDAIAIAICHSRNN